MPQITINADRFDPYKNFKFRVKWDGRYVAGISKVSGLKKSTTPVEHMEAGDQSLVRKSPSRWKFDPITLERGVTHDTEFEEWAGHVWDYSSRFGTSPLKKFRKDLIIELLNEAGQVVLAYKVYRCWVSEYQPMPDLDANNAGVAIERIKIENEGWERDQSVQKPKEPQFDEPTTP